MAESGAGRWDALSGELGRLGLKPGCSASDVRRAYKERTARFHTALTGCYVHYPAYKQASADLIAVLKELRRDPEFAERLRENKLKTEAMVEAVRDHARSTSALTDAGSQVLRGLLASMGEEPSELDAVAKDAVEQDPDEGAATPSTSGGPPGVGGAPQEEEEEEEEESQNDAEDAVEQDPDEGATTPSGSAGPQEEGGAPQEAEEEEEEEDEEEGTEKSQNDDEDEEEDEGGLEGEDAADVNAASAAEAGATPSAKKRSAEAGQQSSETPTPPAKKPRRTQEDTPGLTGDANPRSLPQEVAVICNGNRGTFMVDRQSVVCGCKACKSHARRNNEPFIEMTPTEFERHSGMEASKKWKSSVRTVENGGKPLGAWLDAHGLTTKPSARTPGGAASPSARGRRPCGDGATSGGSGAGGSGTGETGLERLKRAVDVSGSRIPEELWASLHRDGGLEARVATTPAGRTYPSVHCWQRTYRSYCQWAQELQARCAGSEGLVLTDKLLAPATSKAVA